MQSLSLLYQDGQIKITRSSATETEVHLDIVSETRQRAELSRRFHDVKNGLQTLQILHQSLKKGYRFDDALAEQKIDYLSKVVSTLEKEIPLLLTVLKT